MSDWFITDDDCLQCCQPAQELGERAYEFIQINSYGGHADGNIPFFQVSRGRISMSDYSEAEIADALGTYGYVNLEDFIHQNDSGNFELPYRDDGTLNCETLPDGAVNYQLIAEMFFELENHEYVDQEFSSWNDAVAYVARITSLDLDAYKETEKPSIDILIKNALEQSLEDLELPPGFEER